MTTCANCGQLIAFGVACSACEAERECSHCGQFWYSDCDDFGCWICGSAEKPMKAGTMGAYEKDKWMDDRSKRLAELAGKEE